MKPVTVGQLVDQLKKLPKDLPCVYSVDDEGNAYHYVYYSPSIGYYDGDYEFGVPNEDIKEQKINAVCIN